MDHCESTFKGSGALDLYFQSWRPATGREPKASLLVVHGVGEHSGRYDNVVNWFVPKRYAVYAFDLRGHGRSPGARGHVNRFDEFKEDVRAFLAVVSSKEPGRPVFMVAHSLGGLIGLYTVLHDPSGLAGIVASGPLLGQVPVSPALLTLAKLMSRVWPSLTMKTGLDVTALSRDQAVVDAYVSDPLVHDLSSARLGTEIMAAIDWTQAHAAELNLPLLIVHGGADRLCQCEASGRFFEQVKFPDRDRCEYEGYYHEVFNDIGKERVLADVEAWLGARC